MFMYSLYVRIMYLPMLLADTFIIRCTPYIIKVNRQLQIITCKSPTFPRTTLFYSMLLFYSYLSRSRSRM